MSLVRACRRSTQAEKEADALIQGFKKATKEADKAELAFIRRELGNNPILAHRLHSLIQNDSLVAVLDGRLAMDTAEAQEGQPSRTKKECLRARQKRFKHLNQTISVVKDILRKMEPTKYDSIVAAADGELNTYIDVMCFGLRVSGNALLPKEYFKDADNTMDEFIKICMKRYVVLGMPLRDVAVPDIMKGYWRNDENVIRSIFCMGDATKVVDLTFASFVQLVNSFDINTRVQVTQGDCTFGVEDLNETLVDLGVEIPDILSDWTLEGYEHKEVHVAPPRIRPSRKRSGVPQNTENQIRDTVGTEISAALRRRLAARATGSAAANAD
jgi:hypothetical protein